MLCSFIIDKQVTNLMWKFGKCINIRSTEGNERKEGWRVSIVASTQSLWVFGSCNANVESKIKKDCPFPGLYSLTASPFLRSHCPVEHIVSSGPGPPEFHLDIDSTCTRSHRYTREVKLDIPVSSFVEKKRKMNAKIGLKEKGITKIRSVDIRGLWSSYPPPPPYGYVFRSKFQPCENPFTTPGTTSKIERATPSFLGTRFFFISTLHQQ